MATNILIVVGLFVIATTASDSIDYRLPKNFIPIAYDLTIHPNLTTLNFEGYTEILFDLGQASKNVTFHAEGLTFVSTEIVNSDGALLDIEKEETDKIRQFRIVYFESVQRAGQYTIKVKYTGKLGTFKDKGFYKTSYVDDRGNRRWLAATHFEATYARKAFPCFDEPALRANFTVRVRRDGAHNSISNMPLQKTTIKDGYYEDVYQTTPRMSTYLVAFAVSDFKNISKDNYRVFAQPEVIDAGEANIGLDFGAPLMKALKDYTKIKYMMPKMDMIALPEFPTGAEENWGLVTFNAADMLFNVTENALFQKQFSAVLTAHEFVHQWFGDLVAVDWWRHVWLKEGFAQYLSLEIANSVKPEWRLNDQAMTIDLVAAMRIDATSKTRAMTWEANSPDEIDSLYDKITYDKSAMVLRMLNHAITQEVFKDGINKYLTDRRYASAVPSDLWRNLQKAVQEAKLDVDVPTIAATWEHQLGYPLVTVKRDYETGTVEITQEQFMADSSPPNVTTKWFVPINHATSKKLNFADTKADLWLEPNEKLTFEVAPGDWLLVNKQQTGYYRVNYDDKNWNLLADYLNTDNYVKIHPNSRAQLISDTFALAQVGRISYAIPLQITKYLHRETDYIPLKVFFDVLPDFELIASTAKNYGSFQEHISRSLQKALDVLGYAEKSNADEDEEHVNNINRPNVISTTCQFANRNCLSKTEELLQNVDKVSGTLRRAVFCGGLRNANESTWTKIHKRSESERKMRLAETLTFALGCSNNAAILKKYADMKLATGNLVLQNIYTKGLYGIKFSFEYLLKNFETIYKTIGSVMESTLKDIAYHMNTKEQLGKLVTLREKNEHKDLEGAFIEAVKVVEGNVAKAEPYVKVIEAWIDKELKGR